MKERSICIAIFLLVLQASHATKYTWNGSSSSNWNTAANWTPSSAVPTSSDSVYLNSSGTSPLLDQNRSIKALYTTSGSLNLNGFTLTITATTKIKSSTITNGSISASGDSTYFYFATVSAKITGITKTILTQSSTFSNTLYLEKTGTTSNACVGGNTFNSKATFVNSGSSTLYLAYTTKDIFNDTSVFISSGSGSILAAYLDSSNFNGNIYVSSTGTSTGVSFGGSSGKLSIASGKKIYIHSSGFTIGDLLFNKLYEIGTDTINLTLTGTSTFRLQYCNINGYVNINAANLSLQKCTFNKACVFTKTGSAYNNCYGGNTFNKTLTIHNNGTNGLKFANNEGDVFNDTVRIYGDNNGVDMAWRGASYFNGNAVYVNSTKAGITFGNDTGRTYFSSATKLKIGDAGFHKGTLGFRHFTQLGSDSITLTLLDSSRLKVDTGCVFNGIFYGQAPNIKLYKATYNKKTTFIKTGYESDVCNGDNVFTDTLILTNSGTNSIRFAAVSRDTYNSAVYIKNTGSSYIEIAYKGTSGSPNLFNGDVYVSSTAGSGIRIGYGTGYSTLASGKAIKIGSSGFSAGDLYILYLTQNGTTTSTITMTGTGLLSYQYSTFSGSMNITATNVFLKYCTFNSASSFTKTGSSSNSDYGGNIFNAAATFTNTGSSFLRLANTVEDKFYADATFTSTGSSYIDVAYIGPTIFNGNITVNSTGSSTGIKFCQNQGTASLASGKLIQVGVSGFTAGSLYLQNFTQSGSTAQAISLGSSASVYLQDGTSFSGALTISTGNIYLTGSTFSNALSITKTSNSNNYSTGGNIFNAALSLTNSGTGTLRMAATLADDYNGNVSFINSSSGSIEPAYAGSNTFSGDISITSSSAMNFGSGTGTVVLDKSGTQLLDGNTTYNFYHLNISGGTGMVTTNRDINLNNAASIFTIGARAFDINSKTLTIENTATSAISYTTGYIVSEDADNSSKIKWKISTTTGSHVFPFGKSDATQVPFTFNLTSGDAGYLTVSTFPTASNNTPLPTSPINVTNINDGYGNNISSDAVDRFWQIDETGTTATATIIFTYANSEVPATGESSLKPARYNSSTNLWKNTGFSYSNNASANTLTVTGVNQFSPWTIVNSSTPLPVEFISFDGKQKDNGVQLNWKTASEINNDYFTIERSIDGITYEALENIAGVGNSNIVLSYDYFDAQPLNGINYYRIKQTDYNGAFDYTNVIAVNYFANGDDKTQIISTVFIQGQIQISAYATQSQYVNIGLYDISGRQLFFKQALLSAGNNSFSVAANLNQNGINILFISELDGNKLFVEKIAGIN